MNEEPRASEAIFAFCSWLTTRSKPVAMGANHDCAPVAELIGEFIKHNDWRSPRPDYTQLFFMPVEEDKN